MSKVNEWKAQAEELMRLYSVSRDQKLVAQIRALVHEVFEAGREHERQAQADGFTDMITSGDAVHREKKGDG